MIFVIYFLVVDDEIIFDFGDVIIDIEEIDDGWWMGMCCGVWGFFLVNYVEFN